MSQSVRYGPHPALPFAKDLANPKHAQSIPIPTVASQKAGNQFVQLLWPNCSRGNGSISGVGENGWEERTFWGENGRKISFAKNNKGKKNSYYF